MALKRVCDVCGTDLKHRVSIVLDAYVVERAAGVGDLLLGDENIPWPRHETEVDLCKECAEEYGALDVYRQLGEHFEANPPGVE